MSETRDRLLRVDQVCDRLNCSKSQAYWLIAVGELDLVKIGMRRGYRVPESSVTAYSRRDIDRFHREEE